jgi:hypothetical protein
MLKGKGTIIIRGRRKFQKNASNATIKYNTFFDFKAATCSKLAIKQEPTEVAPTLIPKMEKAQEKVGNHNCLADHDYQITTTFVEPKEEEIPS